METNEIELQKRISHLKNLINSHKQKQQQQQHQQEPPQQQISIQPIKPIFNKLPPNHLKTQQYKPNPTFNKKIIQKPVKKTVNYNLIPQTSPTLKQTPPPVKPLVNTIQPIIATTTITTTTKAITTPTKTNNVIFSGYKPKESLNKINAVKPPPPPSPPLLLSSSQLKSSNVIFSGFKPPSFKTQNKLFTSRSTTIGSSKYYPSSSPSSSRIFLKVPMITPKRLTFKPTASAIALKVKRQQILKNKLLVLKKIKQNKPLQSNKVMKAPSTISPKVIDSIFIKKGNSLVRKKLDDNYITIGNKLIRSSTAPTTTTSATINIPISQSKTMVPKPIVRRPIIKPPLINNKMKISEKIKEAINKKKLKVSEKKKKKKQYCLFFNRFGKCNNGSDCRYEHEPKRVRICPKFIAGNCDDPDCKLQHSLDLDLMPICHLFLNRMCTNDNCPYLHVNLSKDTEVCPDFISGYCPKGSKCELKHTYTKKEKSNDNNIDNNTTNTNNKNNNGEDDNNNNNNNNFNNSDYNKTQDSFFDDMHKFYELDNVSKYDDNNNNDIDNNNINNNNDDDEDNENDHDDYYKKDIYEINTPNKMEDIHSFMPVVNNFKKKIIIKK
ncbi:hypothetical protein ACTFIY_005635 [Dictyostelium cf. discoideum]